MTSPIGRATGGTRTGETTVEFTFEGRTVRAREGESLAAALVAAGHLSQRGGRTGRDHGHFCGMGACFECLVRIDGRGGERACMTPVRAGMSVAAQPYRQPAGADGQWPALADPPPGPLPETPVAVLIVGAGPAGLQAALTARRTGAEVTVVDERATPGGQYYKQLAASLRAAGHHRPDRQMEDGRALAEAARAAGVVFRTETLVWGAFRDGHGALRIGVECRGAAEILRPRALVLATGATERPWPVPGWTLPGVMTTGGLQTLLRSYRAVPPGPVVVAGNGPLNLQLAVELVEYGAEVAAVVESGRPFSPKGIVAGSAAALAAPAVMAHGAGYLARLRRAGVPVLQGRAVAAIDGDHRAEAVRIAPVTAKGSLGAVERVVPAQAVGLGYGFVPQTEISRLLGAEHAWDGGRFGYLKARRDGDGATSVPGVFVAGEAAGIAGAQVALAEGAIAGAAAARHCGHVVASSASWRRRLARHTRFQTHLWRAFASPLAPLAGVDAHTLVCRCEDVTAAEIWAAAAQSGRAVGPVKRLTRAGMGRCQGRYCATSVRLLAGGEADRPSPLDLPAPQNPVKPVAAAALAVEKPEWGGHRRVSPPVRRPAEGATARGPLRADVAVIGAGIAGVSTAFYLARAGVDVLLLDAGAANAQASGGNAGSLHVQLLSFDFGAKAESGGGPAARTLPLQQEAARLWETLAEELPEDIEFARTGGLMVAENAGQMAFLERKTALERRYGIASEVIGAAEARRHVPALSRSIVGAAWCAEEGKINPLLATPALLAAARRAGARIAHGETVRAISRDEGARVEGARERGRWTVTTDRGTVEARRLVNAAGAWSASIGRLVGLDVPVHGAPLQMIVTEPAEPVVDVLLAHADRHLTLKQAKNGNLIIGGGWTAGLSDPVGHPRPLRESLEGNLWVAQHVLPAVRGLRVLRSWAAMNVNIDGAPILGAARGLPGFYNAVTSNGYTLGPLVGRITADLIAGSDPGVDIAAFSLERFAREAAE